MRVASIALLCATSLWASMVLADCVPQDLSAFITRAQMADLMDRGEVRRSRLAMGDGKELLMVFEGTSKGNGTLQLSNLLLRIYDRHDDGVLYKDGLLTLRFEDLNQDGWCDIHVTGTVLLTGEKESDPVLSVPLEVIYQFRPATGNFIDVSQLAPIWLNLAD